MNTNHLQFMAANSVQEFNGISLPSWQEILAKSYGLRCDNYASHSFGASITVQEVGEIKIADVRMRTLEIESKSRPSYSEDVLLLKLLVCGSAVFEQGSKQRRFSSGSLIVIDPSHPFTETIDNDAQMVVVTCPKASLRDRGYRHALNRWVAPNLLSPDVRVIQDLISIIALHGANVQNETKERLSQQLLDMFDVVTECHNASNAGGSADATRFRVKRYISRHLGDESLDANKIASGVNLSIGYLNRLFSAEQTSLIRYLWNARLEHGHKMLCNPKHAALRIEQVAWLCGFSNAAHFSRSFRQRYACSPSDLKSSAQ